MKSLFRRLAVCAALLLLAGCNVRHKVETASTVNLANSLKRLSPNITSVTFTFSRPHLYCDIALKKEPTEEERTLIMHQVRVFVTPANMKAAADKVKWKLDISEFHLNLMNDDKNKAFAYRYFTRYFKSYDASDDSEANIDGYRTWYKENGQ